MAALNSALDLSPIEDLLQQVNAFDVLLHRGKNKNISIIGHFPFVELLKRKKIARNLWVFELKPKTDDDLLPEHIPEYVPESDIVLLSGTTLIHHTFEAISGYFNASFNIMAGPSTPLSPILFDFGIDMISGTVVTDKEKARESFSRGAKFREAQGLRFVSLFKEIHSVYETAFTRAGGNCLFKGWQRYPEQGFLLAEQAETSADSLLYCRQIDAGSMPGVLTCA